MKRRWIVMVVGFMVAWLMSLVAALSSTKAPPVPKADPQSALKRFHDYAIAQSNAPTPAGGIVDRNQYNIQGNGINQRLIAACQSNPPIASHQQATQPKQQKAPSLDDFVPKQAIALAHPSNYGERFIRDRAGNLIRHDPIIVLHETVGTALSAINTFQTFHERDEDQVSYHALITRSGTIIYTVPPDKRAFGAGNSVFQGANGLEATQTNPKFPPSVNNFAYHISLESPPDGSGNQARHSGYTPAQYASLAWLVSKTGVADDRITTHRAVDRSGSRSDPRSFDTNQFFQRLNRFNRVDEMGLACAVNPLEPDPGQHTVPDENTGGNGLGE